jgi:hypothetical protein
LEFNRLTALLTYFSGSGNYAMDEDIGLYLEKCQEIYRPALDNVNLEHADPIIRELVKAFKLTPWYLNGWEDLHHESWFS